MKLFNSLFLILSLSTLCVKGQAPTANFSLSPNPVCNGTANVISIIDLSTGAPTAWSYTVFPAMGPQGQVLTTQNPTFTAQGAGVFSVALIASNSNGSSATVVKTLTVLNSPNAFVGPASSTTCPNGSAINLSAQSPGGPGGGGTNTYSWSVGATTSVIAVNPSVTTVYTCVITATNGCTTKRTATVNVGNISVNIVANPVNLCPGFNSTLTANSSGSAPFSYTWSTAANTKNEVVSQPGVYQVTVSTGNGCVGVQSYSIINSSTLAVSIAANSTVICNGNQAMLTGAGGTSYTWSTGGTNTNVNVNPTTTAVYSVVAETGTCQGTASITIQVNQTPTLVITSSSSTVCSGNSVTLSVTGASAYTWNPTGMTGSSIVVTPSTSTIYMVTGSNTACQPKTASKGLVLYTTPALSVVASPSAVCEGEALALSVSGASTYTWSNGSNQSLQIVYPVLNTSYTISGVSQFGCNGTLIYSPVVNECAGVSEGWYDSMKIYPNPSTGHVTVWAQSGQISLCDIQGKWIANFEINASNNYRVQMDALSPGLYVIHHSNGQVFKLLVQAN